MTLLTSFKAFIFPLKEDICNNLQHIWMSNLAPQKQDLELPANRYQCKCNLRKDKSDFLQLYKALVESVDVIWHWSQYNENFQKAL